METTEQIILNSVHMPRYIEQAFRIESWMANSRELIKMASELEKDLSILWGPPANYNKRDESQPSLGFVQGIYFMLIAYAIENMCKAEILKKKKTKIEKEIKKGKRLRKFVSIHDLVKLVRDEVGLQISEPEEELLLRLSRTAVWAARYPVPLWVKDINANQRLSSGNELYLAYFHRDDIKRIKKLINKIESYINDKKT